MMETPGELVYQDLEVLMDSEVLQASEEKQVRLASTEQQEQQGPEGQQGRKDKEVLREILVKEVLTEKWELQEPLE